MNGLEKITEKITGDANAFAEETLRAAGEQAQAITEKYARAAEKESAAVLERGREQAAEAGRRAASVAQLEVRKATLAKKQEMITLAFDKALEKLNSLDDGTYLALLCRFAVENAVSGDEELRLPLADHARFGPQVVEAANARLRELGRRGELTLAAEGAPIEGGLLLRDGDVEMNCTLATMVTMLRESLAQTVAGMLFR